MKHWPFDSSTSGFLLVCIGGAFLIVVVCAILGIEPFGGKK